MLPPPPHPPFPLEIAIHFMAPPFTPLPPPLPMPLPHPTPYYLPPPFYLPYLVVSSCHVILSCQSVMSSCHIITTNLIRYHLDNIYVTTKQYNMNKQNLFNNLLTTVYILTSLYLFVFTFITIIQN